MLNMQRQLVNVDRLQLIEALRTGLSTHKVEYSEAKKDYEAAVVKFLEEATARAKSGNFQDLVLRLTKPENHEKRLHQRDRIARSIGGCNYPARFRCLPRLLQG